MLAFLLEIVAVVALAIWGATIGPVVAVAAPVLLVVVWGAWLAPRATHRLAAPWALIAKVVVFGLAVAALAVAVHPWLAAVVAVLAALHLGLAARWGRV